MPHIPKRLQPILWSQNISLIDTKKDRPYIIHQVLRYGTLEDIAWLKKTYATRMLRGTFLKRPCKVYSASSLNFVKNILLGLGNARIDEKRYLSAAPRSRPAHASRIR